MSQRSFLSAYVLKIEWFTCRGGSVPASIDLLDSLQQGEPAPKELKRTIHPDSPRNSPRFIRICVRLGLGSSCISWSHSDSMDPKILWFHGYSKDIPSPKGPKVQWFDCALSFRPLGINLLATQEHHAKGHFFDSIPGSVSTIQGGVWLISSRDFRRDFRSRVLFCFCGALVWESTGFGQLHSHQLYRPCSHVVDVLQHVAASDVLQLYETCKTQHPATDHCLWNKTFREMKAEPKHQAASNKRISHLCVSNNSGPSKECLGIEVHTCAIVQHGPSQPAAWPWMTSRSKYWKMPRGSTWYNRLFDICVSGIIALLLCIGLAFQAARELYCGFSESWGNRRQTYNNKQP